MLKSLCAFILMMLIFNLSNAQKWTIMMEDPDANFYDVQKEFYTFYQQKALKEGAEPRMDGPYNRFKKWEAEMEPRVYPTGMRPNPQVLYAEWMKQKNKTETSRAANWSFIGPSTIPSNGGGAGKTNVVAIDPNNPQIIWLGSSGGGLWKSTDGGNTWSTNTDQQLPSLVILDISINPLNSNIMYMAIREGVFKSTDGGQTWFNTGINKICFKVQIDPSNSNTLIASCIDGIYRSTDAFATWTQVFVAAGLSDAIREIKFNLGNSAIIYGANYTMIYRSNDNGLNWTPVSAGLPSSPFGIKLAVSPANANYVYALFSSYLPPANYGFYALCRSTDAGLTWSTISNSPNILGYDIGGSLSGGQGAYCMSLAVSPINVNEVYAGGINLWKSTNGGANWTCLTDWLAGPTLPYAHADQQDLEFVPGSGNVLYACHDGGISKSIDAGTNWNDMSNGLEIMEIHKISSSASDPDLIVAGTQDNGTNRSDAGVQSRINLGDGLKCAVDYNDPNTIYSSYQNGALFRSTDGGATQVGISPSANNNFFTNFSINPLNSNTLYSVYDDLYKTTNKGASWTPISSGLFPIVGGSFNAPVLAAPSDTNTIYTAQLSSVFRTSNGGATWVNISPTLLASAIITGLAVSNSNANTVFLSFSSYAAFVSQSIEKVFKTTDGGLTWTDITYSGLPAVAVNCIVYQNNSPDAIYVGTDLGVYYIDNTMNSWIPYAAGLPNVKVNDIDIQYTTSKLRVGTYGRGLWETDINIPVVYVNDAGIDLIVSPINDVCSNNINPMVLLKNFGSSSLTSATIKYSVNGGSVLSYNWTGSISSFGSLVVTLPPVLVNNGSNTFQVFAIQPNGLADLNINNDTANTVFILPISQSIPYFQGFEDALFPPIGCSLNNFDLGLTWERNLNASYSGNASAKMPDFYYTNDGMLDELILPYFNFNSTMPFLTFQYAYQLLFEPAPVCYYTDTLAIYVSTDCGSNWNLVYKKFDLDLVTTTPVFNVNTPFVPNSASDWTFESINLTPYAGNDKVLIKFQNINGRGNNLYIDDINVLPMPVGIETSRLESIKVIPNPSEGIFNFNFYNAKNECELAIYNVLGEQVYVSKITTGSNSIDLSKQAAGLYFYQVSSSQQHILDGKIIIK